MNRWFYSEQLQTQLMEPSFPQTRASATHAISKARGLGKEGEDRMRNDKWMSLTKEPDIGVCAWHNAGSDHCLAACLLPKRRRDFKKLQLFSETRLWLQLIGRWAKRDSFSHVSLVLFDPPKAKGRLRGGSVMLYRCLFTHLQPWWTQVLTSCQNPSWAGFYMNTTAIFRTLAWSLTSLNSLLWWWLACRPFEPTAEAPDVKEFQGNWCDGSKLHV